MGRYKLTALLNNCWLMWIRWAREEHPLWLSTARASFVVSVVVAAVAAAVILAVSSAKVRETCIPESSYNKWRRNQQYTLSLGITKTVSSPNCYSNATFALYIYISACLSLFLCSRSWCILFAFTFTDDYRWSILFYLFLYRSISPSLSTTTSQLDDEAPPVSKAQTHFHLAKSLTQRQAHKF